MILMKEDVPSIRNSLIFGLLGLANSMKVLINLGDRVKSESRIVRTQNSYICGTFSQTSVSVIPKYFYLLQTESILKRKYFFRRK